MSKTAFIGLGAMGSRMAANLLKAGHEVTVCDLVPEAVKKLADSGAKTAASAREAAEGNECLETSTSQLSSSCSKRTTNLPPGR